MRKFKLQISVLVCLWQVSTMAAQDNYKLYIRSPDRETGTTISELGLQTLFSSRFTCTEYLSRLPGLLQSKGYVTASIDSLQMDSSSARMVLYVGEQYKWARVDAKQVEPVLLNAVGWQEKLFTGKPMDFVQLRQWEEKMLDHLENTGYPFARVYLDSLDLDQDKVSALLKVEKGPLYRVDSIRVYGNAKISNQYLQRYLEIPNGSVYSREKLFRVNKKIKELTYVEQEKPFDISMLATGSVLNLYLRQKR